MAFVRAKSEGPFRRAGGRRGNRALDSPRFDFVEQLMSET